ncbi:ABC transporter permease [Arthrobacter zhaoguopingii]|uniref:ABC transporter permease n=1 Tax=Arthrobacter zhaoguopingii TaxID=2681491 RepID=UPI0013586293|nr:ABC transporter permease [Arthrobacter zhaoguopingii]
MASDQPRSTSTGIIETPGNRRLSQVALLLLLSGRTGAADFRRRYTWRTWILGWLARGILEVLFFASIGAMLQDPQVTLYLVIGRSLLIGATETMLAIQTVGWERQDGTMPFLLIGTAPAWPAFVGRALQWLPSATATPLLLLFVLGPILGLRYDLESALITAVAVPLCALSSFGFSMAVAAAVIVWPAARNLVANVAAATIALFCGAFVPVSHWPEAVQGMAQVVPLTHIIDTVTSALLNHDASSAVWRFALAFGLGAAWLLVGIFLLERFVERGRRTTVSHPDD